MTPTGGLRTVRTGRWADPVQSLVLLVGLGVGLVHPLATMIVALPLGVVAPSVRRAFVLSLYLGVAVALAWLVGWSLDTPAGVRAAAAWLIDADLAVWLGVGTGGTVLLAVLVSALVGWLE